MLLGLLTQFLPNLLLPLNRNKQYFYSLLQIIELKTLFVDKGHVKAISSYESIPRVYLYYTAEINLVVIS